MQKTDIILHPIGIIHTDYKIIEDVPKNTKESDDKKHQ